MSDKNLMQALRAVLARELAGAPPRHRGRTAQCPALTRFVPTARWTPTEKAHMDGCAYCKLLLGQMTDSRSVEREPILLFAAPLRLPQPSAWAAQSGEKLDVEGQAERTPLEWRLVEDEGQVILRLRTRESGYHGRSVRYELHGMEGCEPVTGAMILQDDENGWFAALASFDPAWLHEQLGGVCRAVRVE